MAVSPQLKNVNSKLLTTEQRYVALWNQLGAMFLNDSAGQVTFQQNDFQILNGTQPSTPAGGAKYWSNGGFPEAVAKDGNSYQLAELRCQMGTHNQSITSTTPAVINGLSCPVVAGTYLVEAHFTFTWGATAGSCLFRFNGPTISEYDIQAISHQTGTNSVANTGVNQNAGTANGVGYNSSGFPLTVTMSTNGAVFWVDMWCEFTFTTNGTLQATAAEGTSGDSWTVDYGYLVVKPML